MQQKAEILRLIGVIMCKYPSLRFCQIVGNVLPNGDHYYVTDDVLLAALKGFVKSFSEE